MELKAGLRLRSQVCATEVMVIRPGEGGVELRCGGLPMVAGPVTSPGTPAPELSDGNKLGKRYTAVTDASFEVLVVKAGAGTLSDDGTPLAVKDAKPLPSSD